MPLLPSTLVDELRSQIGHTMSFNAQIKKKIGF